MDRYNLSSDSRRWNFSLSHYGAINENGPLHLFAFRFHIQAVLRNKHSVESKSDQRVDNLHLSFFTRFMRPYKL